MTEYDSKPDTLEHIKRVQDLMCLAACFLLHRGRKHDLSKLESPEKEMFDKYTPKLKNTTYGSKQYEQHLGELTSALDHHYKHNSHHPEHYPNGINGMDLFDLIEMLMDWKAASERHDDGNIYKSLIHNQDRYNISDQLIEILDNTVRKMGW